MKKESSKKAPKKALRKTDVRRSALIEWLCDGYVYELEYAKTQIAEAKIWEKAGVITIEYSNGVKNIVKITENGVEQIS